MHHLWTSSHPQHLRALLKPVSLLCRQHDHQDLPNETTHDDTSPSSKSTPSYPVTNTVDHRDPRADSPNLEYTTPPLCGVTSPEPDTLVSDSCTATTTLVSCPNCNDEIAIPTEGSDHPCQCPIFILDNTCLEIQAVPPTTPWNPSTCSSSVPATPMPTIRHRQPASS
jgi:hypothetical protein